MVANKNDACKKLFKLTIYELRLLPSVQTQKKAGIKRHVDRE
ncbi:hypothetical protein ACSAZK_15885 [Methanosarcina sp. Mfa9]